MFVCFVLLRPCLPLQMGKTRHRKVRWLFTVVKFIGSSAVRIECAKSFKLFVCLFVFCFFIQTSQQLYEVNLIIIPILQCRNWDMGNVRNLPIGKPVSCLGIQDSNSDILTPKFSNWNIITPWLQSPKYEIPKVDMER